MSEMQTSRIALTQRYDSPILIYRYQFCSGGIIMTSEAAVQKAILWFNGQVEKYPEMERGVLMNDASLKYNLTVPESELFISLVKQQRDEGK
jgi:hypothetical protein